MHKKTGFRKKRIRAAVFVSAFLLFLFLMDYPYLSRLYNDRIAGNVIAAYSDRESSVDCDSRLAWAKEYNRYLAGEGACPRTVPEWTEGYISAASGNAADITADNAADNSSDNAADTTSDNAADTSPDNAADTSSDNASGITSDDAGRDSLQKRWMEAACVLCPDKPLLAGWIRIPAIDVMLPLYTGTGDNALREGAGILEGSSLPVGGSSTHTCISAHRGLPDRTLFTNLDLLRNRDRIEVHTLGRSIFYEVCGSETRLPSETGSLAILPGRDMLTLITCTPYGINTHRLHVHARRCAGESEKGENDGAVSFAQRLMDPVFWKLWWWVPASALLLFFMVFTVRKSFLPKR